MLGVESGKVGDQGEHVRMCIVFCHIIILILILYTNCLKDMFFSNVSIFLGVDLPNLAAFSTRTM